ncbi:uncharacterized protein A1O5_08492 [Cladophialophora psammophila CBS 110553]|uniref:Uncharacterized protein n=1 Tax=Cladophialophora psammophila CBS 110553 TaxID=1182543 RepID=W9WL98_9EURO|nr:uncharacterized protein A1O5_08492 [Cladophialophora psammophila CBS 110553]EXJ68698.1 hypothetical protein A1O5_08492 [Cladophialophora psammophila CBS 110553]
MHPEGERRYDEYYAKSIESYRQDICDPIKMRQEPTLAAGLLLCYTTMGSRPSWTVHLNGAFSLLRSGGWLINPSGFASEVLTVLGIFDLPTHTIGRRTPSPCIWYNFCRFKRGIESISGIPYTLLDLLSTIEDPDIEDQLWAWTYVEVSTLAQQRMWNATRLAGIISAREYQAQRGSNTAKLMHPHHTTKGDISTGVLIQDILGTFEVIGNEASHESYDYVWNTLLFPLFIAASQARWLSEVQKTLIDKIWTKCFTYDGVMIKYYRAPLDLIHELWGGPARTAKQLAQARNVEISLF